jgi:4-hydroxy-2-oxoglutarate aldolase
MSDLHLEGIYPPIPTFFDVQEELDLATLGRHIARLAESGIAGYVVLGTNGEAPHLTAGEREEVIRACRERVIALSREVPEEKRNRLPTLILAGCGEQSTRATIAGCERAARAGADVALVLPPFYFKGRMDTRALLAHYRAVADHSPLPVVLYNMPASAAGLDLDAALVCRLAEHPNIIGLKDSAGNIARLAQIAAQARPDFALLAGSAGYLLPALVVGARGGVPALANVFPREVCRLQELFRAGQLEEARRLQARLVPANTAVTATYSVAGLKAALELVHGYGGRPRSPVQPLTEEEYTSLRTSILAVTDDSSRTSQPAALSSDESMGGA